MTKLELDYRNQDSRGLLVLGDEWQVTPTDPLLNELDSLNDYTTVTMTYNASRKDG